ncbi:hypothetical protein [Actinoplanes sp. NPDC051851]|uniref:hypothetical protein n=1 Tax=Actinoplanes sp. NPDC051851 TaxID=3154753 RepID=UPI003425B305
MTTFVERAPVEAPAVTFAARERWVLLVASAWLVIGLQLDAYAHATTPELETFWTPWHGVLYSGIAASGFTLLWIMKSRLPSIPTYRDVLALPNALRIPIAGMASLLVGGGVDTLWHNIFGIEKNLEIFVSPSHELIILGMVLVAMGPALMLAATPGDRTLGVSGGFLVAISALFSVLPLHIYSLHASALGIRHLGSGDPDPLVFSTDGQLVHGYLASTALLLLPIVIIGRRWALPIGLPTALVTIPALLMHLMFDSERAWWPQLTVAIAAPIVEMLLRVADALVTIPVNAGWIVLGLVAPPLVWGSVLLVGQIQVGTVGWNVHMVSGLLTLTAFVGAGTVLVARSVQHLPRAE